MFQTTNQTLLSSSWWLRSADDFFFFFCEHLLGVYMFRKDRGGVSWDFYDLQLFVPRSRAIWLPVLRENEFELTTLNKKGEDKKEWSDKNWHMIKFTETETTKNT